jgi:hypothetical protein
MIDVGQPAPIATGCTMAALERARDADRLARVEARAQDPLDRTDVMPTPGCGEETLATDDTGAASAR